MRRGSLIGPIVLILIGAAFLLNNLRPDLSLLRLFASYWPWILIGWGAIRLVELTIWQWRGQPLPRAGISGGEWTFIFFLCLLGGGMALTFNWKERWPNAQIRMRGLEILGETFAYPLADQTAVVGQAPRIRIENPRGNVRLTGAAGQTVKLSGRATVRAFSQQDADRAKDNSKLELLQQGEVWIIRASHDPLGAELRLSTDLEITAPKGATIEGRGRYGDFDVTGIQGDVAIDSDNASVHLQNIAGKVRVETRRSDIVRIVGCNSDVQLKGRGSDIHLEDISGQVEINGEYFGDISFRRLAKPVRFAGARTDLRLERVPGELRLSRGNLNGENVVGPLLLRSRSKDVTLKNFTGGVDIDVGRGDIDLRPERLPLSPLQVRTGSGDITVGIPAGAGFHLKAETERGDVDHDFGAALRTASSHPQRGASVEGVVGTGPEISLRTARGDITVRKGGLPPAPPSPPSPPSPPKRTVL